MSITARKNKSTSYLEIISREHSMTSTCLLTLEECVSLHKELGMMIINARNEPAPDDFEPDDSYESDFEPDDSYESDF